MRIFLVLLTSLFMALHAGHADDFFLKNGDFSKGKAHWEGGGGQIIFINEAGEPTPEKDGGFPVLEVKLQRMNVTELRQRFVFIKGERHLKFYATMKASPDFVRNDQAPKWTKDITWAASGWYNWSSLVYPKVDVCARVDAGQHHHYLPRDFKTKGEWQKIGGEFKDMATGGAKSVNLVLPAGEGTIWIKSISSSAN